MGEAVQHPAAFGKPGHRQAVIFLVQEKAGFLPVFHVHAVNDAVFADFRDCAVRGRLPGKREPALVLLHALQGTDGHVVSLVYAPDLLPVLPEHLNQQRKQHGLDFFHAHGQGLGH